MRWAVVAAAAGVLLLVAAAIALTGAHTSVNEETLGLVYVHKRFPLDIISSVVNGLGLVAFAGAMVFLAGAVRARKADFTPLTSIAATAGAVLSALAGILLAIVLATKAQQFVSHGAGTYQEAHKVWTGPLVLAAQYAGLLGALLLAVAIVMTSLNAMRVGLLTRFMGYLGIFVAVLQMGFIPTPVPVVQAFWLCALAYLMSGRWPTGVPPSWRSGKPEPWPSSAQLREERIKAAAAGGPGGRGKPSAPPAPQAVGASAPVGRGTRAATPKRKRKRRK